MKKTFEVGDRVIVLKNECMKKEYIGTEAYVISSEEDYSFLRKALLIMSGIPSIALRMIDGEIQYIPEKFACDIIYKIQ